MSATEAPRNEAVSVERTDVSPRLVLSLVAGLAIVLLLSGVAILWIYASALHGPSDAPRAATATPQLQIDPAQDLAAYRAAQQRELTTYAWIDRAHGRVRIPIDRAMQDIARGGIKDWPEAKP
jgi:hypothetical protein